MEPAEKPLSLEARLKEQITALIQQAEPGRQLPEFGPFQPFSATFTLDDTDLFGKAVTIKIAPSPSEPHDHRIVDLAVTAPGDDPSNTSTIVYVGKKESLVQFLTEQLSSPAALLEKIQDLSTSLDDAVNQPL